MVRDTCCSQRGPGFGSHTHTAAQNFLKTPVHGTLMPSTAFLRHQEHTMVHIHA